LSLSSKEKAFSCLNVIMQAVLDLVRQQSNGTAFLLE
jgi:hypothetical protein